MQGFPSLVDYASYDPLINAKCRLPHYKSIIRKYIFRLFFCKSLTFYKKCARCITIARLPIIIPAIPAIIAIKKNLLSFNMKCSAIINNKLIA